MNTPAEFSPRELSAKEWAEFMAEVLHGRRRLPGTTHDERPFRQIRRVYGEENGIVRELIGEAHASLAAEAVNWDGDAWIEWLDLAQALNADAVVAPLEDLLDAELSVERRAGVLKVLVHHQVSLPRERWFESLDALGSKYGALLFAGLWVREGDAAWCDLPRFLQTSEAASDFARWLLVLQEEMGEARLLQHLSRAWPGLDADVRFAITALMPEAGALPTEGVPCARFVIIPPSAPTADDTQRLQDLVLAAVRSTLRAGSEVMPEDRGVAAILWDFPPGYLEAKLSGICTAAVDAMVREDLVKDRTPVRFRVQATSFTAADEQDCRSKGSALKLEAPQFVEVLPGTATQRSVILLGDDYAAGLDQILQTLELVLQADPQNLWSWSKESAPLLGRVLNLMAELVLKQGREAFDTRQLRIAKEVHQEFEPKPKRRPSDHGE